MTDMVTGMEPAGSDRSPAARNRLVVPTRDRAWPFPPRHALRAAHASLDPAALAVLGATAQAWGLSGRAPAMYQAD
jgi:hypothetical protein